MVNGTTGVPIDGDDADTDPDTMELTADEMNGAFMVRVQARQPGVDFVDDDTPPNGEDGDGSENVWKTSNTASVTAKN